MECPKCGQTLAEGTNFCGNCGARVAPRPAEPAEDEDNPYTPSTEPLAPSDTTDRRGTAVLNIVTVPPPPGP